MESIRIYQYGKICKCKSPDYTIFKIKGVDKYGRDIEEECYKEEVCVCTECNGKVEGAIPELDRLFSL